MITVGDIAQFILVNRSRGWAFKSWTLKQIHDDILRAYDEKCLGVYVNRFNQINGVAIGSVNHEERVFHVVNILTITPEGMKELFKLFIHTYPGYSLTGNKHDRKRQISVKKLYERLIQKPCISFSA